VDKYSKYEQAHTISISASSSGVCLKAAGTDNCCYVSPVAWERMPLAYRAPSCPEIPEISQLS